MEPHRMKSGTRPAPPATMELRRYDYVIHRLLPSLLFDGVRCVKWSDTPKPGDLVMLQSAPDSDWTLSFYRKEGTEGHRFTKKHLLESLKTGQLCWWENVGFHVIDRDKTHIQQEAEWTDEQFVFSEKFDRACRKGDFYMARPFIARFDGDEVLIKFRTRWGLDEHITEVPPLQWKRLLQRDLLAALKVSEKKHEDRPRPIPRREGCPG